MTTGKCALCLSEPVELIESHIVSRWLYRRLSQMPGAGVAPIEFSEGRGGYQSRQVTKHLLCRPCEDVLGKTEQYASGVALQPDGVTFPARDGARMMHKSERFSVVDLSHTDTDALTHFAASIFWRADVAEIEPITHLGAATRESLRLYLLGETAFPPDLDLLAYVLEDESDAPKVSRIISFPVSVDDASRHDCVLLGFRFTLYTPACAAGVAASLPRTGLGILCSSRREVLEVIAPKIKSSSSYGKLAKEKDERGGSG